jgi:hypothetical protein
VTISFHVKEEWSVAELHLFSTGLSTIYNIIISHEEAPFDNYIMNSSIKKLEN